MNNRELLLHSIRNSREVNANSIKGFTDRVNNNPLHEFEWGTLQAIISAVWIQIYDAIIGMLTARTQTDSAMTLEEIKSVAQETALDLAGRDSRSTNPMANIIHQTKLVCWVEMVKTIQGYIECR